MDIHENIRDIREKRRLTQEEMASQLAMSTSGYAKIERGETKLYHEKLEKIANILQVSINELLPSSKQGITVCMSEQTDCYNNVYYGNNNLEISLLKKEIAHQKETIKQYHCLLEQKDNELKALKEIIELLKK